MNVIIYDADYEQSGEPNWLATRISSFHKQQGDYVQLVTKNLKLPKDCGTCYVLHQSKTDVTVSPTILMDKRCKVIGFKYFNNYQPNAALLSCHPDYLLYPYIKNKYNNSEAWQFTDERGNLLSHVQSARNVDTNKMTIVCDEHLWTIEKEKLLTVLNALSDQKNIYFWYPIPLSSIVHDKDISDAFLKLNFTRGRAIQWSNSLPFVRERVEEVLEFFDKFKELHPANNIGEIAFYPKPMSRTDEENLRLGIWTILQLQQRSYTLQFLPIYNRLDTIYARQYEVLKYWAERPNLAFMDIITLPYRLKVGTTLEKFYAQPKYWSDEFFRCGVDMYHHFKEDNELPNEWYLAAVGKNLSATLVNWNAFLTKELWY